MSQNPKQQRKERVMQWKAVELAELAAKMPISPEQLHRLLDYLDAHLNACDHTTKLTDIFLHVEKLDMDTVLPWLRDQGGYCDCEVLANLDDLDRELRRPPQSSYFVPEPKKKNSPRNLCTVTGWNLSKLPAPWRVGNLYKPDEPIQLQIGKKGGCTLQVIESAMPSGDQLTDDYWSNLWYARTKLPQRGPLQIRHTSLVLPTNLRATIVQSPSWLPVLGWIIPDIGGWHLESGRNRTE